MLKASHLCVGAVARSHQDILVEELWEASGTHRCSIDVLWWSDSDIHPLSICTLGLPADMGSRWEGPTSVVRKEGTEALTKLLGRNVPRVSCVEHLNSSWWCILGRGETLGGGVSWRKLSTSRPLLFELLSHTLLFYKRLRPLKLRAKFIFPLFRLCPLSCHSDKGDKTQNLGCEC